MNIRYIVKEGLAGFKRAKLASTTSIFSLFIAILLIGVLGRVFYNAYTEAVSYRNQIEVEVFLFDIDEATTDNIRNDLSQDPLITDITYISKDSASAIMKRDFGDGVDELVALNFLPASFKLNVDTGQGIDKIEILVSRLQNMGGVDEVKYNAALLKVLESNLSTITVVGVAVGVLILFAALALVYNTIRLTIYAKRDLIRAMKLVGATNGFIRSPFIVEGITQGLISGTLAIFCVFVFFEFFIPVYVPQLGVLEWPFGRWYYLVGGMLLLAIIMGWWGSRWAARRFIAETYISAN
jgi:cell division transport system permease protein